MTAGQHEGLADACIVSASVGPLGVNYVGDAAGRRGGGRRLSSSGFGHPCGQEMDAAYCECVHDPGDLGMLCELIWGSGAKGHGVVAGRVAARVRTANSRVAFEGGIPPNRNAT